MTNYSKDELVLKEMTWEYGAWTDPHLLTPAADPTTSFAATGDMGYIRMGTVVITLADTFAEYKQGTPHKSIRMDLTERLFGVKFTANQFNPTLLAIYYNIDTDTGTYNLHWIGSDAPVKPRYGYLGSGTRVDGTTIKCAVWAGEVVTTAKDLTFSGTDYVDIPIEIRAFKGSTFIANPNNQHNYGMIFDNAGS